MCIDFFDVCVLEAERGGGEMPRYPSVRLVFRNSFPHEGKPVISHDLASDEEIDSAIEDLHRALEDVRNKAKRELKKLNKKAQS